MATLATRPAKRMGQLPQRREVKSALRDLIPNDGSPSPPPPETPPGSPFGRGSVFGNGSMGRVMSGRRYSTGTGTAPRPAEPPMSPLSSARGASPMQFPAGSEFTVPPPACWEPFFDHTLGITYYYNASTDETVWAVDQGWPEVAPSHFEGRSSCSPSLGGDTEPPTAPGSLEPSSPKDLSRRFVSISNNANFYSSVNSASFVSLMSLDGEDDDDGWRTKCDRTTGALYRVSVDTGVRRPYIG
ncbi:hypothetical protein DIPPA_08478 [Diplonema papillatum]|nr:hypothetical protein DIPPA_08478 [Diplonema papillatum]